MGFFDNVNKNTFSKLKEESDAGNFKVGVNPCRIRDAYEDVSKSTGKDMLVIQFENREGKTIKAYIVDNKYKLSTLKRLMTAFAIDYDERDLSKWRGKRGIVICKEGEPYNGVTYPVVSSYKHLDDLDSLRDKEKGKKPEQKEKDFEDDIPF
jgi:hypothetical protein